MERLDNISSGNEIEKDRGTPESNVIIKTRFPQFGQDNNNDSNISVDMDVIGEDKNDIQINIYQFQTTKRTGTVESPEVKYHISNPPNLRISDQVTSNNHESASILAGLSEIILNENQSNNGTPPNRNTENTETENENENNQNNAGLPNLGDNQTQNNPMNAGPNAFFLNVIDDFETSLDHFIMSEVGKKYKRGLGLLGFKCLVFLQLFLVFMDVYSFQVFVIIATVIEGAYTLYRLFKLRKEEIRNRSLRWRSLILLDWIFVIQYQIWFILKIDDNDVWLSYATLPGFLNILLFCWITDPPRTYKNNLMIVRLALWTQLSLISLKLDGNQSLSWNVVFLGVWFYLGLFLIVTAFNFIFLILMGCLLLRGQRLFHQLDRKSQLVGLIWYFAVVSVSGIWLSLVIGVTRHLSKDVDGKELMRYSAIAGMSHSILLIIFALLFKTHLITFIAFTTRQNLRIGGRGANYMPPEALAVFEDEKVEKTTIFDMISQTYFVPLKTYAVVTNKDDLKKLKEQIWRLKNSLVKLIHTNVEPNILMREKGVNELRDKKQKAKIDRANSLLISPSKLDKSDLEEVPDKLSLSENDIKIVSKIDEYKKSLAPKAEVADDFENLCFICAEKEPNAIFLDCGHGGVCYECAQKEWKERNKCMTCRSKIEKIIKLHPIKNLNIAKATMASKKVYKVELLAQNNGNMNHNAPG